MTQKIPKDEGTPGDMASETAGDASSHSPMPSRRKQLIRKAAVGLIILIIAFSIPYFLHSLSHESTDDAFIDGNIVPVSPRVAGHVIRVFARDNRWVQAGDLLVELDPRDFEARLDAAKATLESATAANRSRHVEVELTRMTPGRMWTLQKPPSRKQTPSSPCPGRYWSRPKQRLIRQMPGIKEMPRI
jgi:membrane fusion protein (multidrug efflux system)